MSAACVVVASAFHHDLRRHSSLRSSIPWDRTYTPGGAIGEFLRCRVNNCEPCSSEERRHGEAEGQPLFVGTSNTTDGSEGTPQELLFQATARGQRRPHLSSNLTLSSLPSHEEMFFVQAQNTCKGRYPQHGPRPWLHRPSSLT